MNIKSAAIWSILSNIAPQVISPVVFIALGRLLKPEDYGVFVMSLVVIGFVQLFKDAGFGQVIIQANEKDVTNFVFTMQLGIGVLLYTIIFIFSPYIALFYKTPQVENVIKIMGLSILISPFVDIPVYLSMREINFRAVFVRNSTAPFVSGVVSIVLALNGFGYWALVLGQLVGQGFTAFLLLFFVSWKPNFEIDWKKNKLHLGFAKNIFAQGMFSWVMGMFDKLLLGRFEGKSSIGYYELAMRASNLPYTILSVSINKLMHPIMAEKRRRNEAISRLYIDVTKKVSLISIPSGVFLIMTSDTLFKVFLGEKWIPSVPLFNYMIVGCICATLVTLNIEVYKAINRPDIMTKFMAVRAIVSLPVYYFFCRNGAFSLAVSRAVLALLFSPVNAYIVTRVIGIRFGEFLNILFIPAVIGLLTSFASFLIHILFKNDLANLAVQTFIFTIILLISILKFEPSLLKLRG